MRTSIRTSFFTFALVLVAAASCLGAKTVIPKETRESITGDYVGKKVEPFTAVAVSGTELSSTAHGARALIISLWGLNCRSCLEEMKILQPIYEAYEDRGLNIWAINTEDIGAEEIQKGLRDREIELSYDLIPDPGLEITKLFTSWFIPVTLIIDSEGIVQYYKIGFNETDTERIKAKVSAILAQ